MDLRDGGVSYSSFQPMEFVAGRTDQPLTIQIAVQADGDRDPDPVYVDFYASVDTQITPSDFYLGQINLGLSMNSWALATLHTTLPTDLPPGTYYVGWIIDPGNINDETDESNNTAFNPSSLLTVVGTSRPILYVDLNARGIGDGSSWPDAFHDLQDALSQAVPGCEIRVAAGVYTPDRGAGVVRGDRRATFELKTGVTIMGGYAGAGEIDPDARNIGTWRTILSGDLNGNDLTAADPGPLQMDPSRADNSLHVVTAADADETGVLDGVRIVSGCADGWSGLSSSLRDYRGAGMYISGGSPRVHGCTFAANWASADGGALYATDGNPELVDCTLCENASGFNREEFRGSGGAVFFTRGSLALINCSLNGNFSSGSGGGLVLAPDSLLSAVNCCFHANHAGVQAGAIYALDSQTSLINCTLAYNRQDANPGALVVESSDEHDAGTLHVANCILWNDGQEITGLGDSVVTVAHSDVWGGWPGAGNFDEDPSLADPAGPDGRAGTEDDDLRLGPGSPCIDAGDAGALPKDATDLDNDKDSLEPLPVDLSGNARIVGSTVDVGAYEAQ